MAFLHGSAAGWLRLAFLLFALTSREALSDDALREAIAQSESAAAPPQYARDAFMREPAIVDVTLSPDGSRLAVLRSAGSRTELLMQSVSDGTRTRIAGDVDPAAIAWSGDGRRLWFADAGGLSVIDAATGASKRIHRWNRRTAQRLWRVDPRAVDHAIVYERSIVDGSEQHRYLRIDTAGAVVLLHAAERPLLDLRLARDGTMQFTTAYDGPGYDTVIRQHDEAGMHERLRCLGIEACRMVAYDAPTRTLWALSQRGNDLSTLQRQRDGAEWEIVHRDPLGIADADEVLWPHAIAYYGARKRWHALDSSSAIDALQQQLPDASLDIASSRDGRVWLVGARHATWAIARRYLYRPDAGTLQRLFEADDASVQVPPPDHLAPAVPITYRAADGMRVHGYVFLPRGVPLAHVPLIAWSHGGPFDRSYDHYDARVQLLVNRGYAVFLPNFRASTGYGLGYVRAARGDVGRGRLLGDIVDGLDVLLRNGVGDAAQQAAMGHSFGGYASLLAVTHHPARFRTAFAAAPPTDYGWIKQWQAEHDGEGLRGAGPPVAVRFPQFDLPYTDPAWRARMRDESPLAGIARLQAPVQLWAGAHDDRVPRKSIAHYVGAARGLGKRVDLMIDPDGGHTVDTPLGREAYLYLMERTADRAFGGGVMPASAELAAYLRSAEQQPSRLKPLPP